MSTAILQEYPCRQRKSFVRLKGRSHTPNATIPIVLHPIQAPLGVQETSEGADEQGMTCNQRWPVVVGLFLSSLLAPAAETGRYDPPLTIVVVNASTVVSNAELRVWLEALQRQVHEDFAPIWKVDASLRLGDAPGPGEWVCRIDDGPDATPRLLGLHFVSSGGVPTCLVYARPILALSQGSIARQLSHEILEMLADPWLSNVTFSASGSLDRVHVYLREVCDPVSAYSYAIDGVEVADFTYPEFWLPGAKGKQLDHLRMASISLEPTPHSYMLVRYITPFGGMDSLEEWNYIWGSFCMFGPC